MACVQDFIYTGKQTFRQTPTWLPVSTPFLISASPWNVKGGWVIRCLEWLLVKGPWDSHTLRCKLQDTGDRLISNPALGCMSTFLVSTLTPNLPEQVSMLHSPLASPLRLVLACVPRFLCFQLLLSRHLLRVSESCLASLPPADSGETYLKNEVINVELKWDPAAQELCSLLPTISPRSAPHSEWSLG